MSEVSLPARSSLQSSRLLRRLLALSWQYRRECLTVFGFQVVLLALGIGGLSLSGLAIDITRAALSPDTPAPRWPLALSPPTTWAPRRVLLVISFAVLTM